MKMSSTNVQSSNFSRAEVPTAADYYDRLADIAARPLSKELYHELYGIARQLCEGFAEGKVFSNFFSLLGWVCESRGIPRDVASALQGLRRRAYRLDEIGDELLRQDVRLVADFVEMLYGVPVPARLVACLPAADYVSNGGPDCGAGEWKSLRVRVKGWNDECLTVEADSDALDGRELNVAYVDDEYGTDWSYMRDIVHEGSTLGLLGVRPRGGVCVVRWMVYEPDYLMSPSELAGVFEPNAVLPENYFLKSLLPRECSYYTLLGNASGQMLDDLVFQTDDSKASYAESVRKTFARHPLDFWLIMRDKANAKRFHEEARLQFANIKQLVETQMEMVYGFDLGKALLEPSFVSPAVGLAGRMDYLQADGSRLIEQKSGKRDEYRRTHKEPHFVQMMLYQLMLGYKVRGCQPYLLYSRYSDGLMVERPYMELLRQAMEMRNRIVSMQEEFAKGNGVKEFFEGMQVDDFRQRNVGDKLWFEFVKPRMESVLLPFHAGRHASLSLCGLSSDLGGEPDDTSPSGSRRVELAFFYRFYEFLAKEQWLSRMGNGNGSHGYADLWNNPALVRMENGDMFTRLRPKRLDGDGKNGAERVTFSIDDNRRSGMGIANFRIGDAVQIYAYDKDEVEPNVEHQFTLRARVVCLRPDEVEVMLSNAQRNVDIFRDESKLFALEHDRIEAGNALLVSGLYGMLTAPEGWNDRFFLRNMPEPAVVSEISDKYGAFGDLVAKAAAAKDLFLVIGPPGSGKTSCALRYMVEEALRREPDGRLLLMAYTNRAVDELCAMLEEIIADSPDLLTDYLRIGSRMMADEQFARRMLSERVGQDINSVGDIDSLLAATRVIVGTTTTMMQRRQVLGELHISVAFVDEASQILEPYLLPFFTLGTIDKFVLVGDQKQLPAVVMQSVGDAAIVDSDLNALGFTSCATSLFDRMLHRVMALGRSDLYMQIGTQGRMHPQLYGFVNEHFYRGLLRSVPLAHQQRSLADIFKVMPHSPSPLMKRLAMERLLFVDCLPDYDGVNDKVNSAEAEKIAEILKNLAVLHEANGRRLGAEDVGIIVPYRNQIAMVRSKLHEHGLHHLADSTIDTVERYQGSQRDIIIYSFTVRHASQLAFLTSSTYVEREDGSGRPYAVDRKLNVALTRAREQMVLIGNAALLCRNAVFARMIDGMKIVKVRKKQGNKLF